MNPEEEIIDILEELIQEDNFHPRVQDDLKLLLHVIQEPIDVNLRVDRCTQIIEELDKKPDLDMGVRTQLWNLNSLLEQL